MVLIAEAIFSVATPSAWRCAVCHKAPGTEHLQPDSLVSQSRLEVITAALTDCKTHHGNANTQQVSRFVERALVRYELAILRRLNFGSGFEVAERASAGELAACANYLSQTRGQMNRSAEEVARGVLTRWLHADGGLYEILYRIGALRRG